MQNFFLIVGKSGSGKDTLVNSMTSHGFNKLISYTTRNRRKNEKDAHIFVTDEQFDELQDTMVAFTNFNGHRYCATQNQVENADMFITDPDGIEYFHDHYEGDKNPIVVYIDVPWFKRFARMIKRGDSITQAVSRIINDCKAFSLMNGLRLFHEYPVFHIHNDSFAKAIAQLYNLMVHY